MRMTGSPPGGTCTAPVTTPCESSSLPSSGCRSVVAPLSSRSLMPTRLLSPATPNTHSGQPLQGGGLEPLGVRSRHDAKLQRSTAGRHVAGRARGDMVSQRRRPRARVERLPRGERPRTETAQLVAGAAPEGSGSEEPTRDRHVGAASPPKGTHLEHVALGERQHLTGRDLHAVDAHLGYGADDGDMGRTPAAQPRPTARDLDRPGSRPRCRPAGWPG